MPAPTPAPPSTARSRVTDVLFDIRMVIGALFAVYGAVCLVWGLVSFTEADSAKTGGVNLNLWAGAGMLVAAAAFAVWTVRAPIHPDEQRGGRSGGGEDGTDSGADGGAGQGQPR